MYEQEIRMFMKLTGSINMIGEKLPDLIKAIEGINPQTNHQRQVAALRRQSEAVGKLGFIINQCNNYAAFDGFGAKDKTVSGSVNFHESIHVFLARELSELRKILTG